MTYASREGYSVHEGGEVVLDAMVSALDAVYKLQIKHLSSKRQIKCWFLNREERLTPNCYLIVEYFSTKPFVRLHSVLAIEQAQSICRQCGLWGKVTTSSLNSRDQFQSVFDIPLQTQMHDSLRAAVVAAVKTTNLVIESWLKNEG
ncbi:MAG: hypothetical protein KKC78_06460 [Proteobacteria bacterium]|nr:hypothetical protein [Pseudomonadota bacterium]